MFKRSEVFSVYPNHPTATNLSMAAGGVRLLSWLTLAAAVVTTLLILIPAARILSFAGLSHGMYYIFDELDEVLLQRSVSGVSSRCCAMPPPCSRPRPASWSRT